ncbi:tumor necrosis factor receptor superfamily member 1A-like isoform X2 [Rana temporaria]|uniref:tumor necrosis factor receptor superfamily member 1A-like isoform X2 n=1 Tax=Rana temporaria TaxID=8407 RepID=UPI001AACE0D7|nr:tumor necrosis factor receptor superfamily member 1A-like isoform X2 [Rana temporaria]
MEKMCWIVFGLSVLWVSGTLCFPVQPKVLENLPSHNRTLRETQCHEDDEYSFQEMCCHKCPAGTHVADHCTENHRRGSCRPCSAGQDYLASPSGFEACLTCLMCRLDQVQVSACTPKSDTACQCKPGTYCIPGDVCEICNKCSRCGKGKRVKEECTATKNTVCEDIPITRPTSNTTSSYLLPKDLTLSKIVSSTPETDVPKDPDPKNENDNQPTNVFLVAFIVLSVISSLIIVVIGVWCIHKKTKKQNPNQTLLANSTDPSANSSIQSTPIADRANQGVPQPPPETVSLLRSCNAMDPSNGVTEPTEPSNTQGPQGSEDPGPGGDDRGGGGGGAAQDNEPCTYCGLLQPCDCYWTPCFHSIIDSVRMEYIVRLVRDLRVPNNTIDCIIKDNPNNTYEQCYKLLERWRTLTGKQASMETIFSALRNMELGGCVENIINSIRSKNIPNV